MTIAVASSTSAGFAQARGLEQGRALADRLDRRDQHERGHLGIADRELALAGGEQLGDHPVGALRGARRSWRAGRPAAPARSAPAAARARPRSCGSSARSSRAPPGRSAAPRRGASSSADRRAHLARCGSRSARRPAPPCSGSTGRATRSTRRRRGRPRWWSAHRSRGVTRTRAVAARIASTVALLRSWRGRFRGVVLTWRYMRLPSAAPANASWQCE